jgi:hypothetical protein
MLAKEAYLREHLQPSQNIPLPLRRAATPTRWAIIVA